MAGYSYPDDPRIHILDTPELQEGSSLVACDSSKHPSRVPIASLSSGGGGGGSLGDLKVSVQSSDHDGWLLCDGRTVDRSTDLGTLLVSLGCPFGVGDGSSTVNIPDPSGRVPLCAGSGSGLSPRSLGDSGGEETHVLAVSELPSQTAKPDDLWYYAYSVPNTPGRFSTYIGGSDQAHENIPPFLVLGNTVIYGG